MRLSCETKTNNMKHYFKFAMAAMALMVSAGFVACGGDDDDDDGGSGVINGQGLIDNNGQEVRLTGVGNYVINYDANGKLTSIGYANEVFFTVSGSSLIIDDYGYKYDFSTNSKGYITKMVFSYDYTDSDGESEKGSGTISFSYNGSGQLTGFSGSGSSEYVDVNNDGTIERGSEKSSIDETCTWTNGNLAKIVEHNKGTYTDDGKTKSYDDTDTYTYTYGSQVNVTKQYTYYISKQSMGETFCPLYLIGFLGVGTAYLPTGYTKEEVEIEDGKQPYTDTDTYTLTYTLNSNGTIATEQRNKSNVIEYRYSNATRAAASSVNSIEAQLPMLKDMLFKHHRR